MNAYIPIVVLGAIAAAFAGGSVVIATVIGPRRYNRAKLEAYECGIEPMAPGSPGHETTGQRFPVKYYLTAMLFIVFDIEIVFLYPWAVSFASLGLFIAGVLRAEATLAVANLVYLLLLAGGAVVFPADAYGSGGAALTLLPSGALGSAMRLSFLQGDFPAGQLLVLAIWAAIGTVLTARTFSWE